MNVHGQQWGQLHWRRHVTESATRNSDRVSRRQVDKFAERRAELASVALLTLAELGFARTSLREIAQNSDFSHGVLHYYFADKVDLITHCVRRYKADCVKRYDQIVADAQTAETLLEDFAAGMAQTLYDDGTMHRLWYDLRNQSLFEEPFREDVKEIDKSLERMIGRIVDEYARLAGRELAFNHHIAYGMLDGLFYQSLVGHFAGDVEAGSTLQVGLRGLFPPLLVSAE